MNPDDRSKLLGIRIAIEAAYSQLSEFYFEGDLADKEGERIFAAMKSLKFSDRALRPIYTQLSPVEKVEKDEFPQPNHS